MSDDQDLKAAEEYSEMNDADVLKWDITGPVNIAFAISYIKQSAFLAGIAHERERSKWISVKERMPEEEGAYLVWPAGKYHDHEVWFTVDRISEKVEGRDEWREQVPANSFYYTYEDSWSISYHKINPTHWMPLPEAPKEEK